MDQKDEASDHKVGDSFALVFVNDINLIVVDLHVLVDTIAVIVPLLERGQSRVEAGERDSGHNHDRGREEEEKGVHEDRVHLLGRFVALAHVAACAKTHPNE